MSADPPPSVPPIASPAPPAAQPQRFWHRFASWGQWREGPLPKPAVDELIEEAEIISKYAVRAGLLADGEFFRKVAAAKALPEPERKLTNAAVSDLQAAIATTREKIPLATVCALQSGWRPHQDRLREKAKNFGFVVVALLLMFAVGHLTLTYKNGVNLFSELSLLRDRSPGLQYGRLERQLLVAQQRLPADILRKDHAQTNANGTVPTPTPPDVSAAAPAPAQESGGVGITEEIQRDLIAQDASFQYAHDLTTLDKELRLVKEKSDAFLFAADAQLAVPQMLWNFSARLWVNLREAAVCSLRVLKRIECTTADGKPLSETELKIQSAAITQQYEKQYASVDVSSVQNFCQDLRHIETAQSNDWDLKKAGLTTFPADKLAFIGRSTYLFEDRLGIKTMDLMRQNCRMNLSYYSQSIPNILDIQNKISGRLATYSYLALPALYGALGSLMYFMRRILDPLLPNPPLLRMIYRVALGALAGMVLAWFWDGTFNNNEAFQTIGFGLFSLAFVFGFAIDVFFTLLDRFVNISTNAVSKIGTTG